MSYTDYPDIAKLASQLGKVKQTVFNKKKFEQAQAAWDSITPEEMNIINQQAAGAVRVLNCFVAPNYIFLLETAVFHLIPVRDTVWIYSSIFTQKMNFIPYNKTHNLLLVDRAGDTYSLGIKSTGGFSKKTPCNDAMNQVVEIIGQQRKGLAVGWTKPLEDMVKKDFATLVASVDANSIT